MTHLITGDSGFIGTYLAEYLLKTSPGSRVTGLSQGSVGPKGVEHRQCDLADSEAVEKYVLAWQPDQVFHLAGTARVSQSAGLPEYYRSNFTATTFLLRALEKLKKPVRFFLASSVHVYGNRTETVGENSPMEPVGHYGFTKFLAERAVEEAVRANPGFSAVVGRLYSCIGPGQAQGFVTSDLAHRLAAISADSTEPLSMGPLDAFRRFLDVRDAAPIFPQLLNQLKPQQYEVYNIASPYELRIRELVELLVKVSGRHCRIQSQSALHVNPFQGLRVTVDKLTRALPGLTFRPVETTLLDIWKAVEASHQEP
jgi:nucleoside-diphosphate-sugar epimerase